MDKLVQTNIVYNGFVDISIKNNGKIIKSSHHNSGLSELFRIIAKSLSGNGITPEEKPNYIDLRYTNDSMQTWESILINKQSISQTNYYQENGFWLTKFAANIPYSEFSISPLNSVFKNSMFRLYLESKNSDLAYIDVSRDIIETILPGSQAIVEWVMRLSNG